MPVSPLLAPPPPFLSPSLSLSPYFSTSTRTPPTLHFLWAWWKRHSYWVTHFWRWTIYSVCTRLLLPLPRRFLYLFLCCVSPCHSSVAICPLLLALLPILDGTGANLPIKKMKNAMKNYTFAHLQLNLINRCHVSDFDNKSEDRRCLRKCCAMKTPGDNLDKLE